MLLRKLLTYKRKYVLYDAEKNTSVRNADLVGYFV